MQESSKEQISILGGKKLNGSVRIQGSKNATLPILISSVLCDGVLSLKNVPNLVDIYHTIDILKELNINVSTEDDIIALDATNLNSYTSSYDLGSKLRASMLILGPLLARCAKAKVPLPGGCSIGMRPVDLHIRALQEMGAEIHIEHGYIVGSVPKGKLYGTEVVFDKISVGATQTILMAACLACGTTKIINAAKEPEIIDLANCLKAMGAKVKGEGTSVIEVVGVEKLSSTLYNVMADRIEAGSYAIATLACGGDVTLCNVEHNISGHFFEYLGKAGAEVTFLDDNKINIKSTNIINSIDVVTRPYPDFPTDLQSPWMSLMCMGNGKSIIEEHIFENRFTAVPELQRMGANINIIDQHTVVVHGENKLNSAEVRATDLRAGFALIIAALVAEGETKITRLHHLDRGYVNVVEKLKALGADIKRGEII